MTTVTITGPLIYPGTGRPVKARQVTIAPVGPAGAVLRDGDGGLVGATTVTTDLDGDFAVAVPSNAEIDEASGVGPPGTYWRLTVGVRPAVSWLARLDADTPATVQIGDQAYTVVDPTPRSWVPLAGPVGPAGPAGAIPPSVLAERPVASSVPAGTTHYATDSSAPPAVADGDQWQTPPVLSPYVTHVTDATADLTTTISALNTYYRIGSLETADVVWPGGLARVELHDMEEKASGHVMGQTDVVTIARSTDSGSTWNNISRLVTMAKSSGDTVWIPERPIVGLDDIAAGTTVRFRAAVARIIAGSVPVTVPWNNSPRRLVVEALR